MWLLIWSLMNTAFYSSDRTLICPSSCGHLVGWTEWLWCGFVCSPVHPSWCTSHSTTGHTTDTNFQVSFKLDGVVACLIWGINITHTPRGISLISIVSPSAFPCPLTACMVSTQTLLMQMWHILYYTLGIFALVINNCMVCDLSFTLEPFRCLKYLGITCFTLVTLTNFMVKTDMSLLLKGLI